MKCVCCGIPLASDFIVETMQETSLYIIQIQIFFLQLIIHCAIFCALLKKLRYALKIENRTPAVCMYFLFHYRSVAGKERVSKHNLLLKS